MFWRDNQTHSRTAIVINLPYHCVKKGSLPFSVELSEKARAATDHRRGGEARAEQPVKVKYSDDVIEEEVVKKQAKLRNPKHIASLIFQ